MIGRAVEGDCNIMAALLDAARRAGFARTGNGYAARAETMQHSHFTTRISLFAYHYAHLIFV